MLVWRTALISRIVIIFSRKGIAKLFREAKVYALDEHMQIYNNKMMLSISFELTIVNSFDKSRGMLD